MAFNVDAIKKSLEKKDISVGLATPTEWISTGNIALNYILSGRFHVGIPNRRSMMFWGPSGSGKSYFACRTAAEAQKKGYFVFLLDSEHALDEEYLQKCGIDLSDDKFLSVRVSTLEEVAETMSTVFKENGPNEKIFFLCDSLSMLETKLEAEKFDKGEIHNDMGLFPKRLKAVVKNINAKIGHRDCFFVCTNHCYQNQDMMNGKGTHIPSGGEGFIYIPSMSVFLKALKLKDPVDKSKILGVKIRAEITKSRYTQLGGKAEFEVPYADGISESEGLITMGVEAGLIKQNGAWYSYVDRNGKEVKFQRKNFDDYYRDIFQLDDLVKEYGNPEEVEE